MTNKKQSNEVVSLFDDDDDDEESLTLLRKKLKTDTVNPTAVSPSSGPSTLPMQAQIYPPLRICVAPHNLPEHPRLLTDPLEKV